MFILIEADSIKEILDEDECLVPIVEDLLLDALIEYKDTPTGIYAPLSQIGTKEGLNIKITIQPETPAFIHSNGNGKEGHDEPHNTAQQDSSHRDD